MFALGAALAALGLILGSLLTFWIGEETLRTIQRGLRQLALATTGQTSRCSYNSFEF
ncbi:MAG: hypothetical protein U0Z44_15030 [Kouleothrix sp.]